MLLADFRKVYSEKTPVDLATERLIGREAIVDPKRFKVIVEDVDYDHGYRVTARIDKHQMEEFRDQKMTRDVLREVAELLTRLIYKEFGKR